MFYRFLARLVLTLLFPLCSQSYAVASTECNEKGNEIWGVSFDEADRSWFQTLPANIQVGDMLTVDCSMPPLVTGSCAMKLNIEPRQEYVHDGALRVEASSERYKWLHYSRGQHRQYDFAFMIDSNWQLDDQQESEILWQFKRYKSQPDAFIAIKQGKNIVLRIGVADQIKLMDDVPRGRWVRIRITVNWSDGDDGRLQACVLDVSKSNHWLGFEHKGPNMRDGRSQAAYLKWGIYAPGLWEAGRKFSRLSVWFDDIHVRDVQER